MKKTDARLNVLNISWKLYILAQYRFISGKREHHKRKRKQKRKSILGF